MAVVLAAKPKVMVQSVRRALDLYPFPVLVMSIDPPTLKGRVQTYTAPDLRFLRLPWERA